MVYRSDEKEKAVPLISRLLHYVFPYLRNHRYGRRTSVTPPNPATPPQVWEDG